MEIDLTDESISLIRTYAGSVSGTQIGAIPDATTKGVAVSFYLSRTEANDWNSITIEKNGYQIALPNLNAWDTSVLALCNKYPEASNKVNGGEWNSFLNTYCFVTVSISPDSIKFYKDGTLLISYAEGDTLNYNNGGAGSKTIADFCAALLSEIQSGGFTFGGGIAAKNLILTYALTDEQAASIASDYAACYVWNCSTDGHKYIELSRTGNDCIGYSILYSCMECSAQYTEKDLSSALGHKYQETSRTEATCTEDGTIVYTCSKCSDFYSVTVPALGHSFTNYVSDNNATCTQDGTETATCDRCDATDTRTEEGSVLGHDWKTEWTTDDASHWHECTRCEETADYGTHSGGTATCTQKAVCEVCNAEYGELAPHVYDRQIATEDYLATAATCTSPATYYYSCSCGAAGSETFADGEALGHSFTNYVSDNNATCTQDGTETAVCDRCDVTDTRTEEGSALGHDEIQHEAKAPTCTEKGWNAYVTCSRCDYTTYVELPALGHTWSDWTVTKEPTYTDQGNETRTCEVCGKTETRETEALGLVRKLEDEVSLLDAAETRTEKFQAIRNALLTYGDLTDAERKEVSAAYSVLKEAIAEYNASAEAVNEELISATELALQIIASATATMSALAAAWFVVKKLF